MRFKIYNAKTTVTTPILLALQEVEGEVSVIVVDSNGNKIEQGCILVLGEDGAFYRCAGVSPEIGLKLDNQGKIREGGM